MRKIDFLDMPLHAVVALWVMRQFTTNGELEKANVIYTDPQQELKDLMAAANREYRDFNQERLDRRIATDNLGLVERLAVRIYARYVARLDNDLMVAQKLGIVHTGMFRRK